MAERFSPSQRRKMHNPILQTFRFLVLNFKIINIVTRGHGGTRSEEYKKTIKK